MEKCISYKNKIIVKLIILENHKKLKDKKNRKKRKVYTFASIYMKTESESEKKK